MEHASLFSLPLQRPLLSSFSSVAVSCELSTGSRGAQYCHGVEPFLFSESSTVCMPAAASLEPARAQPGAFRVAEGPKNKHRQGRAGKPEAYKENTHYPLRHTAKINDRRSKRASLGAGVGGGGAAANTKGEFLRTTVSRQSS